MVDISNWNVALPFGFVVTIAVVGMMRKRTDESRIDVIHRWAADNGWTVTADPDIDWNGRIPGIAPYGTTLLLTGLVDGRPVGVAEYEYVLDSPDAGAHYLIVTAVRLDDAYPEIAVREREPTDADTEDVGTGHPEFDEWFAVRTTDPARARAALGPALIAEHLAQRVPPWTLAGYSLVSWQVGQIMDPAVIPELAAPLVRVADHIGQ